MKCLWLAVSHVVCQISQMWCKICSRSHYTMLSPVHGKRRAFASECAVSPYPGDAVKRCYGCCSEERRNQAGTRWWPSKCGKNTPLRTPLLMQCDDKGERSDHYAWPGKQFGCRRSGLLVLCLRSVDARCSSCCPVILIIRWCWPLWVNGRFLHSHWWDVHRLCRCVVVRLEVNSHPILGRRWCKVRRSIPRLRRDMRH